MASEVCRSSVVFSRRIGRYLVDGAAPKLLSIVRHQLLLLLLLRNSGGDTAEAFHRTLLSVHCGGDTAEVFLRTPLSVHFGGASQTYLDALEYATVMHATNMLMLIG